jgi:hypothetical protein
MRDARHEERMNDTLLLLVPIAAEHKALLLERVRVIDAPDAASRAAAARGGLVTAVHRRHGAQRHRQRRSAAAR